MRNDNEPYLKERLYRFYSPKTFVVMTLALGALAGLEYFINFFECDEKYWGPFPGLTLGWIYLVFCAFFLVIHRMRRAEATLGTLQFLDKLNILISFLVAGIMNPVFALSYTKGSWWAIVPCLAIAAMHPHAGRIMRGLALAAPSISLGLHYAFWNLIGTKPLDLADPCFVVVYTAVIWFITVMVRNRQFNFKLESSNESLANFLGRYSLSVREKDVTLLVYQGLGTAEIAQKLFISPETVRTHMKNVYQKTGTHSRSELATLYYRG